MESRPRIADQNHASASDSPFKSDLIWRALALAVALPFVWAVAAAPPLFDDPYITFRYARNILNGLGFVYNPGERIMSTTTPLFTLLLVALSPLQPDLPRLANIISFFSLLGAAWILPDVLMPRPRVSNPNDGAELAIPAPVRALATLIMPLLAAVIVTLGSETCFYLFLALLALRLGALGKYGFAGLCAGLAAITRGDGVLLLPILLWQISRDASFGSAGEKRSALVRCLLGFGVATLPWYGFSLFYFGALSPVTLAAKQGQLAHVTSTQSFLRAMVVPVNNLRKTLGIALFAPYFILLVWGIVGAVRRRSCPPLIQWSLLYIVSYTLLRVASYHWYYVPLVPAALWLLFGGVREAVTVLTKGGARLLRPAWAMGFVVLAFLGAHSAFQAAQLARIAAPPGSQAYRAVGEWLGANTPPQARVGALEIGLIGFYSGRPIVDFAGLIQPDVARLPGPSYVDWARGAALKYRPEYLALVDDFRVIGKEAPFASEYVSIHNFKHPGHNTQILRRRNFNPQIPVPKSP